MKLFIIFFLTIISSLSADVIFLNNGNKMMGIIQKKDSTKITLDKGFGLMSFDLNQIDSIKYFSKSENNKILETWHKKYFRQNRFIPVKLKSLYIKFEKLEHKRKEVLDFYNFIESAKNKKSETLENISNNKELFYQLNLEMKASKDNWQKYNSLLKELRKIQANINIENYNYDKLTNIINNSTDDLVKQYDLELKSFQKKIRKYNKKNDYIKILYAQIENFKKDFSTITLNFNDNTSNRNQIIVKAKINNISTGRFIFDTGATTVTISKFFANKIGIDDSEGISVKTTMADGNISNGKMITLNSIKVHNVESKNVKAIILNDKPTNNIDGLLGMSFLKDYIISIDAKKGQIILKKFHP